MDASPRDVPAASEAASIASMLASIERGAHVVATDAAELMSGLQGSLQQISSTSVQYMDVCRDTAEHSRQAVSSSVAVGNSFLEKLAELDDRMEGVATIRSQLRDIERALSSLEAAVDSLPPAAAAESRPPETQRGSDHTGAESSDRAPS